MTFAGLFWLTGKTLMPCKSVEGPSLVLLSPSRGSWVYTVLLCFMGPLGHRGRCLPNWYFHIASGLARVQAQIKHTHASATKWVIYIHSHLLVIFASFDVCMKSSLHQQPQQRYDLKIGCMHNGWNMHHAFDTILLINHLINYGLGTALFVPLDS